MAISSIGKEGIKQIKTTPNWDALTPVEIRRKTRSERPMEKSHSQSNLETTVLILTTGPLTAPDLS